MGVKKSIRQYYRIRSRGNVWDIDYMLPPINVDSLEREFLKFHVFFHFYAVCSGFIFADFALIIIVTKI